MWKVVQIMDALLHVVYHSLQLLHVYRQLALKSSWLPQRF
jgi:hypothetical protein